MKKEKQEKNNMKSYKRNKEILIRVSEEEKNLLKTAADRERRSMGNYLVSAGLARYYTVTEELRAKRNRIDKGGQNA